MRRPRQISTIIEPFRIKSVEPDYAVEAILNVYERRDHMGGYEITHEPAFLRHFTCRFAAKRAT